MADTRDEAVEQAVENWAQLTETYDPSEVALISDASNKEIARLNARAQHYRAERGELGELEVQVPGVHYGVRQGDRVAMIDQHHEPGVARIENGSQGEVLDVTPAGGSADRVRRDRPAANIGRREPRPRSPGIRAAHPPCAGRDRHPHTGRLGWLAGEQGVRLRRGVRARQGTDWFVSREDLGVEGHDTDRIQRLAQNMRRSHAQTPSLAHPELPDRDYGPRFHHSTAPSRTSRIPGIVRTINRIVQPPSTPPSGIAAGS